jgi:hypothetical protein
MKKLLLHPLPLPDEWIGSWIARLTAVNYAPTSQQPTRLLKSLGIDEVREPLAEDQLNLLSTATGVDLATLQVLNTLPTDLILQTGRSGSEFVSPTPFLGVRYLVACPECLMTDQQPYFRRSWLSQLTFACPTHGGPLYEGCPHCHARIALPVPLKKANTIYRRRIPTTVTHRSTLDLRQCWNCHGDLATQTSPLDRPLRDVETLPRHFASGFILDRRTWSRLVRALRVYVNVYDLASLIGFGQLNLTRFSPKITSSNSAEARYRTEQVVVWLLSPMAAHFTHPHRRIRLMAGALLGLVSAAVDSDTSRRWLHTAWLGTRLLQDTARTLTLHWPDQVTALVSLFQDKWIDPRQPADPYFQLHEEPWQMMAPLLNADMAIQPLRLTRPHDFTRDLNRMTMNSLLQHMAFSSERDFRKPGMNKDRTYTYKKYWSENGQLGIALAQLYRAVRRYRSRLTSDSAGEPDWVESTVAILMCDSCIELTRTVNPALHKELFLELIHALEQRNT